MDSHKLLFPIFSLFFFFSLIIGQGLADHHHHHHRHSHYFWPTKLLVFGDSFVDTGNIDIATSSARKVPYGITFPGKPSGRFSDGRVLTDYTARFLGLKSPIPFSTLQKIGLRTVNRGVNFAFGGSGVFKTLHPFPNMTTQIDFFQKLIADSVFNGRDIHSSAALVAVSGNDYAFYQATNGSDEGLRPYIISVVNQITVNLKRIQSLGVRKILVTGVGPLGCYPDSTVLSSFRQCNATQNKIFEFHNLLLKQAVAKLNSETKDSPFFILDLFSSFLSIIQNKGYPQGNIRFKTPLKPCCYGVSKEFSCGSVDKNGNKKYSLCKDPKSAFFWDGVHPSQQGWLAAFSTLKSSLRRYFSS